MELPLRETVGLIEFLSGSARFVICDVSNETMVEAAVEAAVGYSGRLDIGVNAAYMGLGSVTFPLASYPTDLFDLLIARNVRGTFLSMKHELLQMQSQGFGVIVNVISGTGSLYAQSQSGHIASESAAVGLTKSAASEYAEDGIRVNCVCPGRDESSDMSSDGIHWGAPTFGIAEPIIIADAIVWLCSNQSPQTTGVALSLDELYRRSQVSI